MAFSKKIKMELLADRYLPFIRHSDENTIITRCRGALQILKFDGVSFRTADTSNINTLHDVLSHAVRNIAADNLMLYVHIIRSIDSDYPEGKFRSEVAQWIDARYRTRLEKTKLFRNDIYLTVYMQPRGLSGMSLGKGMRRARKSEIEVDQDLLTELDDKTTQLQRTLSQFGPRKLSIIENGNGILVSEPATALKQIITGQVDPVPLTQGTVGNAIYTDRVIFGREALEIRHPASNTYGAFFGIKEYPTPTRPNMFDGLLTSPFRFVFTQSFRCIAKNTAVERMTLKEGRMRNAGDAAVSQADDLKEARDDLMSGKFVMGEHNLSLLILSDDMKDLKNRVADAKALLSESGAVVAREDLAIESQFWAQLPGNHAQRARTVVQTSRNFTSMAPLHNYPTGHKHGNEWGDAIAKIQTEAGSPFYFNFHIGDLGHTFICGPSGSGKTVVQTFLASQLEKFGGKTVIFDKDYGAEIFVRASKGTYLDLRNGRPTGCAPFLALEMTPDNQAFMVELVKSMLGGTGAVFTADDEQRIDQAVLHLGAMPQTERTVRAFRDLLGFGGGAEDIGSRMDRWIGDGRLAWVFDNPSDEIGFDADLVGFDMTDILDYPEVRNPIMMYLMRRIENLINGQRIAIIIDEFWKALSDPYFSDFVRNKLKVIRKQNGIVIAATQSASDVIESPIARTVIEQCASQIWFSNDQASKDHLITHFGLTQREYGIVRAELPVGHFLVKQKKNSVVCDLDLSGLDDVLTVLSGRTETNEIMYPLISENSDPAVWLPKLFQIRKETKR